MRFGQKILSVILCVIMMFGFVPTIETFVLSSSAVNNTTTEYKTGDIVEFGSYPQSEVTDETLKNTLASTVSDSEWISYNYYCTNGYVEGSTRNKIYIQSDYMKYQDINFKNGEKYRAVTFSSYRPYSTFFDLKDPSNESTDKISEQDNNGYYVNTIYYFKFEPLEWRILDPDSGLLLCESIIDSQPFDNTIYYKKYPKDSYSWMMYSDYNCTICPSDYKTCSLRNWLNNDFWGTAFSSAEKNNISLTSLTTDYYFYDSNYEAQQSSEVTDDYVFLISGEDVLNTSYGFTSKAEDYSANRRAHGTDYAKCQGLYVGTTTTYYNNDTAFWWLRSPRNCVDIHHVWYDGNIGLSAYDDPIITRTGIRPAIKLSNLLGLKNLTQGVGKIVEFGSYPQTKVTDSSLLSKLNAFLTDKNWEFYNYYIYNTSNQFMKYADIKYGDEKYRAVTFSSYRPECTRNHSSDSCSNQDDNGYNTDVIYWFKYEPIEWYVLDPANSLLLCKNIIDSQAFCNTVFCHNNEYYNSSDYTNYANDYVTSSIREWLNDDFYKTAFTDNQKGQIKRTNIDNRIPSSYDNSFSIFSGKDTKDNVFLLSYNDVYNKYYSICSYYESFNCLYPSGTEYAKCQGLYKNWWSLRTAGTDFDDNCYIGYGGYRVSEEYIRNSSSTAYGVTYSSQGVRPAISLTDLSSVSVVSEPDWSISDDGILTISGNGAMPNYEDITLVPWYDLRNAIKEVIIEEGITRIGKMAFAFCNNMTQITIPISVKSIESMAFYNCSAFSDVYYDGSFNDWDETSFFKSEQYNNPLFDATYHFGMQINESPVPVKFDNGETSVLFKNQWFENNGKYNHQLAQFCADYSMMGYCYNENSIKEYLEKLGFKEIDTCMHTGRDEVNYFIAQRDVLVNNKIKTLIFIGTIGSYNDQWYSDFDPQSTERAFWKDRDGASYYSNDKDHMGFGDGLEYVYNKLSNYEKNKVSSSVKDIIVLSTGHSRGAAISNMLAARLIDEAVANNNNRLVDSGNIYAYTFATPNVTSNKDRSKEKYNPIHNIVNPEDFVTYVLLEKWGYGKYGQTYVLPSWSNSSKEIYNKELTAMQVEFYKYTGGDKYYHYLNGMSSTVNIINEMGANVTDLNDFYNKPFLFDLSTEKPYLFFKNIVCRILAGNKSEKMDSAAKALSMMLSPITDGLYKHILLYFLDPDLIDIKEDKFHFSLDFANAHQMETYCAYIKTLSEARLLAEKKPKFNIVKCPVDVDVFDNITGELVGRIRNNVVDETVLAKSNAIDMFVDGDSKQFWIPSDADYRVVLIGNDNGTMNYTVQEFDAATGKSKRVNFFDVEVENGLTMTGTFVEDIDINDYELTLENGTSITPTESFEDDSKEHIINITTEGPGYATESMSAISGDYISLVATPKESSEFIGWYENGELISKDQTYSFIAKSNRNLVAKFSNPTANSKLFIGPRKNTVDYRSNVIIYAKAENVPEDYAIVIADVDASKVLAWGDNKEAQYTIEQIREPRHLAVWISKKGNTVGAVEEDADGNKLGGLIDIDVRDGLFNRIVAFFKALFGRLPETTIKPESE